jgi:hypothetical protein
LAFFGAPKLGFQLKSGVQSTPTSTPSSSPVPIPTITPMPTSSGETTPTPTSTPTLEGNQIILPYGQWVQYNQYKLRYIREVPFPFPPKPTYQPRDYVPELQVSKSNDPDKEGGIQGEGIGQGITVHFAWNLSITIVQENNDYLVVTINQG